MTFALVVTIIGFLLLFDKLGLISSEVWSLFWPLVIIFIGLSMLFNRLDTKHFFGHDGRCGDCDHGGCGAPGGRRRAKK